LFGLLEDMPVLSRFYGIVIFMNFRDHEPPHFYAGLGKGQSEEKPG